MRVRIALIQPLRKGLNEDKNRMVEYLELAIKNGAKIICFPEGYPGPFAEDHFSINPTEEAKLLGPIESYETFKTIRDTSKREGVYIIAGFAERINDDIYNTLAFLRPDGQYEKYYKVHPASFETFTGGKRPATGREFKTFRTEYGVIGVAICWEAQFPEIPRILAINGAEIMFFPTGGRLGALRDTWKTIIWARAIENLAYTCAVVNLYGEEEGFAIVASPEKILVDSTQEGVIIADLDLDRIRKMREAEEDLESKVFLSIPGLLKFRKGHLYKELCEK